MRQCGICGLAPRPNDSMSHRQVLPDDNLVACGVCGPASHLVCGECLEAYFGGPRYAFGDPQPARFIYGTCGDQNAYYINTLWCGICHRYAREGSKVTTLGLFFDEFQPIPEDIEEIKKYSLNPTGQGVFCCCGDCRERFRPAIYERWKAQGTIKPEMPYSAFTFEALH